MRIAGTMLLVACSAGALSQPTLAGFYTGNELLELCESFPGGVSYYVMGYLDAELDSASAVTTDGEVVDTREFICIPNGVQSSQVRDAVCKYLEDNPADRQYHASFHVYSAIREHWPCPVTW